MANPVRLPHAWGEQQSTAESRVADEADLVVEHEVEAEACITCTEQCQHVLQHAIEIATSRQQCAHQRRFACCDSDIAGDRRTPAIHRLHVCCTREAPLHDTGMQLARDRMSCRPYAEVGPSCAHGCHQPSMRQVSSVKQDSLGQRVMVLAHPSPRKLLLPSAASARRREAGRRRAAPLRARPAPMPRSQRLPVGAGSSHQTDRHSARRGA